MDETTRAALRIALDVATADRDRAEATIALLSEKLGLADASAQIVLGPGDGSGDAARDVGPVHVQEGEFYGLSQTAAAVAFLTKAGRTRPQRTGQIVEALAKGGIKIGGKNPPEDTIYKILNRDPRFHRPAPNTWGLSAWYPNVAKKGGPKSAVTTPTVDPEISLDGAAVPAEQPAADEAISEEEQPSDNE